MTFWISDRVYLSDDFDQLLSNWVVFFWLHKDLAFAFLLLFNIREFLFKIDGFSNEPASICFDQHQLKDIKLLEWDPILIEFFKIYTDVSLDFLQRNMRIFFARSRLMNLTACKCFSWHVGFHRNHEIAFVRLPKHLVKRCISRHLHRERGILPMRYPKFLSDSKEIGLQRAPYKPRKIPSGTLRRLSWLHKAVFNSTYLAQTFQLVQKPLANSLPLWRIKVILVICPFDQLRAKHHNILK